MHNAAWLYAPPGLIPLLMGQPSSGGCMASGLRCWGAEGVLVWLRCIPSLT